MIGMLLISGHISMAQCFPKEIIARVPYIMPLYVGQRSLALSISH